MFFKINLTNDKIILTHGKKKRKLFLISTTIHRLQVPIVSRLPALEVNIIEVESYKLIVTIT